ncbi:hypothetical protein EAF07_03050 [Streptococcus hillyeri]|uniref:Peptidase C39-like domain-containing protein n=2 Tax=Streptococcus hillyeri TaxID=2282420 RepID=A0A3L9DVV2_9STRE|nr:hypothetical protein EAF07_03050 [Streptococcus hillyeri]
MIGMVFGITRFKSGKGADKVISLQSNTTEKVDKDKKEASKSEVTSETTDKPSEETEVPSREEVDNISPEGHLENNRQRVILNVTQQIQQTPTNCAPTTVSMLLSYKGIDVSQEILAQEMGTDTSFGTHNKDAIAILNKHLFGYESPAANQAGYRLETITNPEKDKSLFKERLKKNIADGYPMYYTIELSTLYPDKKGEHNVVGIGYEMTTDGNDIASVYYLDPLYSMQDPVHAGLKKITVDELLHSTSVCVEPNYGW